MLSVTIGYYPLAVRHMVRFKFYRFRTGNTKMYCIIMLFIPCNMGQAGRTATLKQNILVFFQFCSELIGKGHYLPASGSHP